MGELTLRPMVKDDIQWIREQRNRPELMRYFRQDKIITEREQEFWWKGLDTTKARLFVVMLGEERVGYVGFNPFLSGARMAEFGIFIIPEFQGRGHGEDALLQLLKFGFEICRLSTIYSDVIDYPGEHRFEFYKKIGFLPYAIQNVRYKKGTEMVPAIKFYMMKDMWEQRKKEVAHVPCETNPVVPVGSMGNGSEMNMAPVKKRGRPRKVHPL